MNIALILNIALISKDLEYFLNNFTHKNLWFSMNQKFRNKPLFIKDMKRHGH